jgi:hypothetical protein
MTSTIILNQTNIVPNSGNSQMVYNFPSTANFDNCEIAVSSINMYYSWENISVALGNNTFSYTWVTDAGNLTFECIIPDGQYEISDINNFLQYEFLRNGTYLINESNQPVWYIEMLVNAQEYAVQVNTFPVPTSLPSGWSYPVANPTTGMAGWIGNSSTVFNPSITFPSNFNNVVGYTSGFSTSLNSGNNTNLSYLSDNGAPNVQPNSTLYVSVSGIQNPYAIPNSIIYSISPTVAFGEQIVSRPPNFTFNTMLGGTYSNIRLKFCTNNCSGFTGSMEK